MYEGLSPDLDLPKKKLAALGKILLVWGIVLPPRSLSGILSSPFLQSTHAPWCLSKTGLEWQERLRTLCFISIMSSQIWNEYQKFQSLFSTCQTVGGVVEHPKGASWMGFSISMQSSSAVRSGTFRSWRQETKSVCSLAISTGIHVVQLTFTSNLKSRWVWVLLLLSDNFTLPTTDLVYWWEQVLHAKEGEYEEFYSFSLCCLVDQCHFKWLAPKLYPFL